MHPVLTSPHPPDRPTGDAPLHTPTLPHQTHATVTTLTLTPRPPANLTPQGLLRWPAWQPPHVPRRALLRLWLLFLVPSTPFVVWYTSLHCFSVIRGLALAPSHFRRSVGPHITATRTRTHTQALTGLEGCEGD